MVCLLIPPAVSVVVPTLNEAGNIGRLLEEVFAACGSGPAIEVVVVDDGSTVVVTLILFGGFLHYLALGLPGVVGYDHNMTLPVAWEAMGRLVEDLAHTTEKVTGQEPLIVGMDKYFIASQMAFYRRDALDPHEGVENTTSHNLFDRNGLMYEYWFPSREQNSRTLILVSFDAKGLENKGVVARVRGLGPIQEQSITKNGRTVGHYFYRLAYGYHAGQDKERPMGHTLAKRALGLANSTLSKSK